MPNNNYLKGAGAERALRKILQEKGFRVVRAGGSGSDGESPDLIVLSTTKKFGLECKAWNSSLSLDKTKVLIMQEWEKATGMPIYVAWKRSRQDWTFLPLALLRETPHSYTATNADATGALSLEQLCEPKKTNPDQ